MSNNLICALSGQSPIQDPVVTPTGQICSKKLLLQKLIETNYMNPFTPSNSSAMPLDESQLVEIQTDDAGAEQNIIPPKPSSANSIPSILNTLSSEYDALVLELYDTRKALEETRKELSVALYQNDAAVRVIARVVLERDLARRELAEAVANGGSVSSKRKRDDGPSTSSKKVNVVEQDNDVQMQDASGDSQIPAEHSKKLQDKWTELCKGRKNKTKAGPNHATLESISKFESSGKRYHKSNNKGVSSLVASPVVDAGDDTEPVIVSAGKSDKQLIWYNPTKHQIQKSHTLKKAILNTECLSTYNHVTAAVTEDFILNVYSGDKDSATLVLDTEDAVIGVKVHPTCEHVFVSTESGKTHIVHIKEDDGDAVTLESVAVLQCLEGSDDVKCTCMGLHPDGLIMALGRNDGKVTVWDLKTEKLASTFEGSSTSDPSSPIKTMTFSEKGYHVAVSTADGSIAVWDLRKQKIAASLSSDEEDSSAYASALSFDPIGKFLAYGTSNGQVVVTTVKEWEKKTVLDEKKKSGGGLVSGIVWGADAQSVVTTRDDDRTLKFWHAAA